jgi:hypothetical protein
MRIVLLYNLTNALMSSGEDIKDLIQQLQELQLQQAALLTQLARASLVKTNAQKEEATPYHQTRHRSLS